MVFAGAAGPKTAWGSGQSCQCGLGTAVMWLRVAEAPGLVGLFESALATLEHEWTWESRDLP